MSQPTPTPLTETPPPGPALPPLALGVCSWSLQVKTIPELSRLLGELGVNVTQIACGDPHHASWEEGDAMPEAARASGLVLTGAMLGFPGEDYTTPQTIKKTGGFGDPGRKPFLDTLAQVVDLARREGVTVAFETGQETASLLRRTLDDLKAPSLKVNFDPANMLLYDKDDPIRAVELLAPDIRSVHVKDAHRPKQKGAWGDEVPLGKGQTNTKLFVKTLKKVGYRGPLCIEREVGDQQERFSDIEHGVRFLRACLAEV